MKRNDYNYESFYYTSDSCLILMNEVRYKKNDFGEMILVPDETKEEVIYLRFTQTISQQFRSLMMISLALMLLVKLNGIERRQELCLLW